MDLSLLTLCLCVFVGVFGVEHYRGNANITDSGEMEHFGYKPDMENPKTEFPENVSETKYPINDLPMWYPEDDQEMEYPKNEMGMKYLENVAGVSYPKNDLETNYPEHDLDHEYPKKNPQNVPKMEYPIKDLESEYQTDPEAENAVDDVEMEYPKYETEMKHPHNNPAKEYLKIDLVSENLTDPEMDYTGDDLVKEYHEKKDDIDNNQNLKMIKVLEGENVTLGSGSVIKQRDHVVWTCGFNTRIGINVEGVYYDNVEKFGNRLHADLNTGSLTIKDVRTADSGLYHQNVRTVTSHSLRVRPITFNVTVYEHLPTPTITSSRNCSSSSERSSKCVVLCSVNVTDVHLSWHKGSALLSSINVNDLNVSLNLEVEYQDNNTYACVVKNPVNIQTQPLNIPRQCQSCSEPTQLPTQLHPLLALLAAVLGIMLGVCYCCCGGKQIFMDVCRGHQGWK